MSESDLAAHVERSRKGPCFVCAYLGGHPDYEHVPVHANEHVVAFLSRYPTLLGYTIVAPRAHVVAWKSAQPRQVTFGIAPESVLAKCRPWRPTKRIDGKCTAVALVTIIHPTESARSP